MNTIESLPLFQEPQRYISPINSSLPSIINQHTDIFERTLDTVYPERHLENKSVIQAIKVLGNAAEHMNATELQTIVSQVQYLVDTWLDEFEMELFEGSTLYELLEGKQ
jgi:hypothetical protein